MEADEKGSGTKLLTKLRLMQRKVFTSNIGGMAKKTVPAVHRDVSLGREPAGNHSGITYKSTSLNRREGSTTQTGRVFGPGEKEKPSVVNPGPLKSKDSGSDVM